MNGIENTKKKMPILKNDKRSLNNDHVLNKNVVNIYIVYKLDPLAPTRDTSYTIQNALFGAMQITKNATDNSKK